MPAYITHNLLGTEALARLEAPEIIGVVERNRAAYDWGTQGPDLLFFHRVYLNPFGEVIKTGVRMHRAPVPPLLNAFLRYLRERRGEGRFETDFAYFLGFLTHYVLDRTAHPYVYAMVEERAKLCLPFEKKGLHHQIESAIDAILCRERLGIQAKNYPLFYRMKDETVHRRVARMLHVVIRESMGENLAVEDLRAAFSDTLKCEEFLLDTKGTHRSLSACIDRLLVHGNLLEAMLKPEPPPFDAVNRGERPWRSPAHPERESRQSFFALFEEAAAESARLMTQADALLHRGEFFPDEPMEGFDNGSPSARDA
ncbi:zinc dependent phospholipase C family protein [Zongyangia hominis]|uniref:Zinc dependent phospholipase C family protein n=1 Tax=Zongyangia hominis TaxID=2763677 RepID=A0A926EC70_9FIRM|nr:zinc dependent phospholipase C family protein [Zongyangia hominis]MBC8571123.1 zinc dependent phospholipase C family protein [Zongyangia hominis]